MKMYNPFEIVAVTAFAFALTRHEGLQWSGDDHFALARALSAVATIEGLIVWFGAALRRVPKVWNRGRVVWATAAGIFLTDFVFFGIVDAIHDCRSSTIMGILGFFATKCLNPMYWPTWHLLPWLLPSLFLTRIADGRKPETALDFRDRSGILYGILVLVLWGLLELPDDL